MRFDWWEFDLWEFIVSMISLNTMFWLGFYRGRKYEKAHKADEVDNYENA